MYKYGNIEDAKEGDIIERVTEGVRATKGKLYILPKQIPKEGITVELENSRPNVYHRRHWKLILTKPGTEAKPGDEVIYTGKHTKLLTKGDILITQNVKEKRFLFWNPKNPDLFNQHVEYFKILQKETTMTKQDLKSGMVLEFEDNTRALLLDNEYFFQDRNYNFGGSASLNSFLDDDLNTTNSSYSSVFAIYEAGTSRDDNVGTSLNIHDSGFFKQIWKRPTAIEMTLEEVCKILGKNIKIVK